MCNFSSNDNRQEEFKWMINQSQEVMRNPQTMSTFPNAYKKGHCPRCGKYLSHKERHPRGHCSRSMCWECYQQLILWNEDPYCIICQGQLPNSKIREIRSNPREVRAHIHEGACKHLYTVIHNVAVDDSDNEVGQLGYTGSLLEYIPQSQQQIGFVAQPHLQPIFSPAAQNPVKKTARNLNDLIGTRTGKPIRVIHRN